MAGKVYNDHYDELQQVMVMQYTNEEIAVVNQAYEIASKADIYETIRAFYAFLK